MDWIKKNYDRLLLGLFGAFALISGGLLAFKAFSGLDVPKKKAPIEGNDPGADMTQAVAAAMTKLASDKADFEKGKPIWSFVKLDEHKQARLLTANPLVQKAGVTDPISILSAGSVPLRGIVPNWWLYENGLDLTRDDVLELDADGDRYANGLEFGTDPNGMGLSNPRDSESQPPFYVKLQLVEVIEEKYEIRFMSVNDKDLGIRRLAPLNAAGKMESGLTFHVGDTIFSDDNRFSILKVENEGGQNVLFLEDKKTPNGNPVKIPEKGTVNRPSYRAKLKGLFSGTEAEAKEGGEVTLSDFPGVQITVTKIHANRLSDPKGENDSIEIEYTKAGKGQVERASIRRTVSAAPPPPPASPGAAAPDGATPAAPAPSSATPPTPGATPPGPGTPTPVAPPTPPAPPAGATVPSAPAPGSAAAPAASTSGIPSVPAGGKPATP